MNFSCDFSKNAILTPGRNKNQAPKYPENNEKLDNRRKNR